MMPAKLCSYISDPYQTAAFVIIKKTITPDVILRIELKAETLDSINVPIKTHKAKAKYITGILL